MRKYLAALLVPAAILFWGCNESSPSSSQPQNELAQKVGSKDSNELVPLKAGALKLRGRWYKMSGVAKDIGCTWNCGSDANLWVVGYNGKPYHRENGQWVERSRKLEGNIYRITSRDADRKPCGILVGTNDVWCASYLTHGFGPFIQDWEWHKQEPGAKAYDLAFGNDAPSNAPDIWIISTENKVHHYEVWYPTFGPFIGKRHEGWKHYSMGKNHEGLAVRIATNQNVWVVAKNGILGRMQDNGKWQWFGFAGADSRLVDVGCSRPSRDEAFVVSYSGKVYRYNIITKTTDEYPGMTTAKSIAADASGVGLPFVTTTDGSVYKWVDQS